jgi:hypothetical protein
MIGRNSLASETYKHPALRSLLFPAHTEPHINIDLQRYTYVYLDLSSLQNHAGQVRLPRCFQLGRGVIDPDVVSENGR